MIIRKGATDREAGVLQEIAWESIRQEDPSWSITMPCHHAESMADFKVHLFLEKIHNLEVRPSVKGVDGSHNYNKNGSLTWRLFWFGALGYFGESCKPVSVTGFEGAAFLFGTQCLLFKERNQKNGSQGSGRKHRDNEKNKPLESSVREFKSGFLPRVCLTKFLATVSFISLSWIITKVVAIHVKHEAVYLVHSWW